MAARNPKAYAEARRLRREHGTPLRRIAARFGISVSTAHLWTKDIRLSPEQQQRNRRGPGGPQSPQHTAKLGRARAATFRERRRRYQEEGRARARDGDALHMAGCMLYWAEGSKDRNRLVFSNSDRPMIRFFVGFLRGSLAVADAEMSLRLNVYLTNGLSLREIEDHWLWALELPRSSLRKHSLNHFPTSSSGSKRNKLPHGVCTLCVRRSTHLVQHIYGAIQEYGGFEEPRWLDGPPRRSRARGS